MILLALVFGAFLASLMFGVRGWIEGQKRKAERKALLLALAAGLAGYLLGRAGGRREEFEDG